MRQVDRSLYHRPESSSNQVSCKAIAQMIASGMPRMSFATLKMSVFRYQLIKVEGGDKCFKMLEADPGTIENAQQWFKILECNLGVPKWTIFEN